MNKILTDRKSGYSYALWLLSRADCTSKMVKDKLISKELPSEIAEDIVTELEERGYIDNFDYARKFIADKCNLKNKGRKYIEFELIKKGFTKDECESLLSECYESTVNSALNTILRKLKKPIADLERKELDSVKAKLLRQGFSWEEISVAIAEEGSQY